MSITENLEKILKSRFGKDVRQSIHDAIEDIDRIAEEAQDSAKKSAEKAETASAESAIFANDCRNYAAAAFESAQDAFSTTPAGYEEVVETVKSQNVHFSSGKEINVPTKKGGIRLQKIEGGQHKSANICGNLVIATITTTGELISDTTRIRSDAVKVNGNITASCEKGVVKAIHKWKVDGAYDGYVLGGASTLTITYNGYVRVLWGNADNSVISDVASYKCMLNEGTEPLPYEPYGLRVAGDMGLVNLWELDWSYGSVSGVNRFKAELNSVPITLSSYIPNAYANEYSVDSFNNISDKNSDKALYFTSSSHSICIVDKSYTNVSSFVAHLKDTKPQLAFEVADGATPSQYCEVIKEHGKNLFSKANFQNNLYMVIDGTKSYSGGFGISDYLQIEGNKTYIISGYSNLGGNPSTAFYDKDRNFIGAINNRSETFETPQNAKYFIFSATMTDVDTLQIEEGTEATEYVPYESKTVFVPTSQPLCKGDYITKIGGKWFEVHTRKKYVYDGTETEWQPYVSPSGEEKGRFYAVSGKLGNFLRDNNVVSNYEFGGYITQGSAITEYNKFYLGSLGSYLWFATEDSTWLSKLKNNPLEFIVTLPSPDYVEITDQATLYQLESYDGQTHITTADKLATLSIGYGKSDTVATALNAERIAKKNEAVLEQKIEYLTNAIISMGGTV